MMSAMMIPMMVMANSAAATGPFVRVKKVHGKQRRRCSRSSTSSTSTADDVRVEPTHSVSGEPLNQTMTTENHTGHVELAAELHEACHRKLVDFMGWATFPVRLFLGRFHVGKFCFKISF